MQSLPRLLLVGFAAVALAAPVASQRPDDQILPKSAELQRQARDMISAGKLEQAEDLLETALARLYEVAPMTDKDIVSHLRDQGIRVARRTVTKYRNQLGILPSTFR